MLMYKSILKQEKNCVRDKNKFKVVNISDAKKKKKNIRYCVQVLDFQKS